MTQDLQREQELEDFCREKCHCWRDTKDGMFPRFDCPDCDGELTDPVNKEKLKQLKSWLAQATTDGRREGAEALARKVIESTSEGDNTYLEITLDQALAEYKKERK